MSFPNGGVPSAEGYPPRVPPFHPVHCPRPPYGPPQAQLNFVKNEPLRYGCPTADRSARAPSKSGVPIPGSTMPLSHFGNGAPRPNPSGPSNNQIHIFTTSLANQAATAVAEGKYPSIIAYHKKTVDDHNMEPGMPNSYSMSVTPPAFSQSGTVQTPASSLSVKPEPRTTTILPPNTEPQKPGSVKRSRTTSVEVATSEGAPMHKAPASVPPTPSYNPATPLERAASVSAAAGPPTPTFSGGSCVPLASSPCDAKSSHQSKPASSYGSLLVSSGANYSSPSPKILGDDPLSQMERLANESLPLEPPLKHQRISADPRSGSGKQISQQIILDDNALTSLERENRERNLQTVMMLREQFHLDAESGGPGPDCSISADIVHHQQGFYMSRDIHPQLMHHGGFDPNKQAWEEMVAKHETNKTHHFDPRQPHPRPMRLRQPPPSVMYGNKPAAMVAPQFNGGYPRGPRGPPPRRFMPPEEYVMGGQEEFMMQQQQWGPPRHPGMMMQIRGNGQASMQVFRDSGIPPNDLMMISEGYGGGGYPPPEQQQQPHFMGNHHPGMMQCGPPEYPREQMMMMSRDFPPPQQPPVSGQQKMMGGNFELDFQGVLPGPPHHPHHQPTVNNTYVNATMSIQQLNIQNVGPPIGHHPGGQAVMMEGGGGRMGPDPGGNDFNMAIFQGLAEPITNLDSKVPSSKLQYFPAADTPDL